MKAVSNWLEREITAKHTTSPEVLAELALDEAWIVRLAVAGNPNMSPETMWKLCFDRDGEMRERVKKNPSFPTWMRVALDIQLV